jgi:galactose mutarotase-like enzyme
MLEFVNGFGRIQATTTGGQLLSWQIFKDHNDRQVKEILYQGSEQKRTGIPILFPFADPLDNNIFLPTGKQIPQHGFARNSNWKEGKIENGLKLLLSSNDLDPIWRLAYPYDFDLDLELLVFKNKLTYNLTLINRGVQAIPIAPGIHPYFPIKHHLKNSIQTNLPDFDFDSTNWDEFNQAQFTNFMDTTMEFEFDDYSLKITEKSPIRTIDHLVIWTQREPAKDVDFVCLEPFTRQTNGINTNPILVEDTWQMLVELEVELKN